MQWLKELFQAILDLFKQASEPKEKMPTLKPIQFIPKYGDNSEDVKVYQQALKDEGADPGAIDGVFGRKTKAATSYFQKAIGLAGSGEPGPKTIEALGLIVKHHETKPPGGEGMTPYQWAQGELGQKEIKGSKDNPRIVEYHKETTLKATDDETPWCASFVCFCLHKAGMISTRSAAARSFLNLKGAKAVKLADALPGDIVVFSRGSNGWSGHVSFYLSHDSKNIRCLGGNQSNSVSIADYSSDSLLGIRRPMI